MQQQCSSWVSGSAKKSRSLCQLSSFPVTEVGFLLDSATAEEASLMQVSVVLDDLS